MVSSAAGGGPEPVRTSVTRKVQSSAGRLVFMHAGSNALQGHALTHTTHNTTSCIYLFNVKPHQVAGLKAEEEETETDGTFFSFSVKPHSELLIPLCCTGAGQQCLQQPHTHHSIDVSVTNKLLQDLVVVRRHRHHVVLQPGWMPGGQSADCGKHS